MGALEASYTLKLSENGDDVEGAGQITRECDLKHQILSASSSPDFWMKEFDEALQILEAPVADSIIGATNFLFKEVAKNYKVVFSGEGADELLGGYVHYALLRKIEFLEKFPFAARSILRAGMGIVWSIAKSISPYPGQFGILEREKLKRFLIEPDPKLAYHELVSLFHYKNNLDFNGPTRLSLRGAQQFDLIHWLPNYTLRRVDFISASYGLEVRVPYLDHRLVELVLSSPSRYLMGRHGDKSPLREAHYKNYSKQMIWKNPKTPFLISAKDTNSSLMRDAMIANLENPADPTGTIRQLVMENNLLQLLKENRVLSPLESKMVFSAYLTARWFSIQNEHSR